MLAGSIIVIVFIVLFYFLGFLNGYASCRDSMRKELSKEKRLVVLEECRKSNHDRGFDMSNYFTNRGFSRIVVYGLGRYYYDFMDDICTDKFEQIYLADKNSETIDTDQKSKVFSLNDIDKLDYHCIVVTSIAHYNDIKRELLIKGVTKPIIAYSDLIFNLVKECNE